MRQITKTVLFLSSICLFLFLSPLKSYAVCDTGYFLNPITNIDWMGVFPIRVGGVPVVPGIPDEQDYLPPVCVCTMPVPRIGTTLSFWAPDKLAEVVSTPFCFQAFGIGMSNPAGVFLGGSRAKKMDKMAFFQAHYYTFPIWAMMGLFTDLSCLQASSNIGGSPAIAYISEPNPVWQSDILAAFASPETVLFANPAAQLSCIADSVSAQIYQPLDPLFWCMGSWGSVFPLDGDTGGSKDYVQDSAAIAGKTIFMMHQDFIQEGTTGPLTYTLWCQDFPDPIWIKSAVRLDLSMPVPEPVVQPIGQDSVLWSMFKNPPYIGDNFVYTVFNEKDCCAF